jgi:HK97 family phage major capsid protein
METLADVNRELRERHAGRLFGRWARAMALGRRAQVEPSRIAEQMRWVEAGVIASITKAAVGADTTSSSSLYYPLTQDLAPLEAKVSAVRRMQAAMRQIPGNRNVITPTAGATAYWLAEGAAAPMSALAIGPHSGLQPMRLSALSAITNELAETSNAEAIISGDHGRAKADKLDSTLSTLKTRARRKSYRRRSPQMRGSSSLAAVRSRWWTPICVCSSTR